MKRKMYLVLTTVVLLLTLNITSVFAAQIDTGTPPQAVQEETKKVSLTDAQKNELKQLYNKKFEVQKQIIQKYVDYGVITKEQADLRIKKMDEMQKRMEQDGFILKHGSGKRGGHKKTETPN